MWVKMALISQTVLDKAAESSPPPPTMKVTWGGFNHKFQVIRISDNSIIKEGFTTRSEANKWASDHVKALAA
jgi:hypothetical protein